MDSGKILLLDLSSIGSKACDTIGRLVLSMLHLSALDRHDVEERSVRPFHVYCDEPHRFATDVMEDLAAETQKSKISLTFAHQYMRQFSTRKTDTLSSVGATIMFRVDGSDAQHLREGLQGKADVDDLAALQFGRAIVRIADEMVLLRTLPPLEMPRDDCRDLIVQRSHERYCRPTR